jgi:hypothetical protein
MSEQRAVGVKKKECEKRAGHHGAVSVYNLLTNVLPMLKYMEIGF